MTTLLDEEATYENIIRQLTTFTNKTKKGDIVYLHFSTHGQPVEDLNADEDDGWDEAIVPIDAYKLYKKGVTDPDYCILKFTAASGRYYCDLKTESFEI